MIVLYSFYVLISFVGVAGDYADWGSGYPRWVSGSSLGFGGFTADWETDYADFADALAVLRWIGARLYL
jgi:hypothetical protein